MRTRHIILSFLFMTAVACGKKDDAVDARAASEPEADAPNQAQVLDILRVTHQGEIDAGKLALEKTGDQRVKDFAQMMIDEHGQGIARLGPLATAIASQPSGSKWQMKVAEHNSELATKLREKTGSDFDKAYADAMVQGHEGVLENIRDNLAPQATHQALRDELAALDRSVTTHLEHAKRLRDQLK